MFVKYILLVFLSRFQRKETHGEENLYCYLSIKIASEMNVTFVCLICGLAVKGLLWQPGQVVNKWADRVAATLPGIIR